MFNGKFVRTIRKAEEGFTLIEVAITSAVFGIIIIAVFSMLAVGVDVEDTTMGMADMENQSRIVLERIIGELQGSIWESIQISPTPAAGDAISFQVNEGYVGGVMQESNVRRLAFKYGSGEEGFGSDQVDNNGNGIIDEGVITAIEEDEFGAPVSTVILTHWIKGYDYETGMSVRGLSFNRFGANLVVRLELQKRNAKGRFLESVSEAMVRIRNRREP